MNDKDLISNVYKYYLYNSKGVISKGVFASDFENEIRKRGLKYYKITKINQDGKESVIEDTINVNKKEEVNKKTEYTTDQVKDLIINSVIQKNLNSTIIDMIINNYLFIHFSNGSFTITFDWDKSEDYVEDFKFFDKTIKQLWNELNIYRFTDFSHFNDTYIKDKKLYVKTKEINNYIFCSQLPISYKVSHGYFNISNAGKLKRNFKNGII